DTDQLIDVIPLRRVAAQVTRDSATVDERHEDRHRRRFTVARTLAWKSDDASSPGLWRTTDSALATSAKPMSAGSTSGPGTERSCWYEGTNPQAPGAACASTAGTSTPRPGATRAATTDPGASTPQRPKNTPSRWPSAAHSPQRVYCSTYPAPSPPTTDSPCPASSPRSSSASNGYSEATPATSTCPPSWSPSWAHPPPRFSCTTAYPEGPDILPASPHPTRCGSCCTPRGKRSVTARAPKRTGSPVRSAFCPTPPQATWTGLPAPQRRPRCWRSYRAEGTTTQRPPATTGRSWRRKKRTSSEIPRWRSASGTPSGLHWRTPAPRSLSSLRASTANCRSECPAPRSHGICRPRWAPQAP